MTTFGTQSITTLNNLNMEGEFKATSTTQFEHVNTATITYADTLGEPTDTATSGKTITLYDAIAGSNVTFTYKNPGTGATPGTGVTDFERVTGNADSTATNLQVAINNQTNFTAAIDDDTNTITITQNTSKSFNPNGSIHHLCYEVSDINSALKKLLEKGLRVLGDGRPKPGAHGKPVVFLHPKDFYGTLIELEEV